MTRSEALTIRLGAYNEILDALRLSTGKMDAMERMEAERDRIRFEIRRLQRATESAAEPTKVIA